MRRTGWERPGQGGKFPAPVRRVGFVEGEKGSHVRRVVQGIGGLCASAWGAARRSEEKIEIKGSLGG